MHLRLAAVAVLLAAGCGGSAPEPAGPAASHPKYGPETRRLAAGREYLATREAPDFWALIPYYVPQRDVRSCSLASMTMVLNGTRSREDLRASEMLFEQDAVLERTGSPLWVAAVSEGGQGLTLDELGEVARECLAAHGVEGYRVDVVHADGAPAEAAFHDALVANEASAGDFLVLNYLQGICTGDPEGAFGHFSPVAAHDAANRRVLILDTDRAWYEPYWVPEATVFAAMSTVDDASGKTRGFLWIRPDR